MWSGDHDNNVIMHVCTMHIVCERAPTHVLCTSAVNIIEDLRGAKEGNLAGGESAPPTVWGGVSNTKQICLLSGGDKDFQTNPPVQCGHKTDDGGVLLFIIIVSLSAYCICYVMTVKEMMVLHAVRPEVRRVHGGTAKTTKIAAENGGGGGGSVRASSEDGFMCVAQERSVFKDLVRRRRSL